MGLDQELDAINISMDTFVIRLSIKVAINYKTEADKSLYIL